MVVGNDCNATRIGNIVSTPEMIPYKKKLKKMKKGEL